MNIRTEPIALKALFRNKKGLFGLVYEFNLLPAGYIHKSWIESLIPYALFQQLTQSKRGAQKLSRLILAHNHLDRDFFYDFGEPFFRLALLPPDIIEKLTLYCGIVLNHANISAVIERRLQEKIKDNIGQEGLLFAQKKAPLLLGNHSRLDNPALFKGNIKEFLINCGSAYFLSNFADAPESLLKRLLWKFPRKISRHQDLFYWSQNAKNQWLLLRRIIKHTIEVKWHHLFS